MIADLVECALDEALYSLRLLPGGENPSRWLWLDSGTPGWSEENGEGIGVAILHLDYLDQHKEGPCQMKKTARPGWQRHLGSSLSLELAKGRMR